MWNSLENTGEFILKHRITMKLTIIIETVKRLKSAY
jgi:ribosomal protein L32